MLGKTLELADNTWFIQGEMPTDASKAPDWCNVVIYRAADRVYLVDTGGGYAMRASIEQVLREIGPAESFTLINTHSHLDHICNNDVILTARAEVKRHYLLAAAIDFAKTDFAAHMAEEFEYLDSIYDPFSSYQTNRRRYRFAGLLRDGLGFFAGRERVLRRLFNIQFRKFKPVNDSFETMQPLDDLPGKPLRFGDVSWTGWRLGGDDVLVFQGSAHAPGDVLVYIPEHKMLCAGDITFPLFPTFHDSSRDRILECLRKGLAMARNGSVEILADGHGDRCYRGGAEVEGLLDGVIADHLAYEQILREIFVASDGLTPHEVYRAFTTFTDRPVVNRYLSLEFPHTPPSLQNVMVTTLLQLGFHARGPNRHKRFYRDTNLPAAPLA